MIIPNTAINRRSTVLVFVAMFSITGIYSYLVLPRESNPEVVIPVVNVVTTYEGVAPEDIESLITQPIERKLTGLAGVKKITSESMEGASSVTIEFEADRDIDDALQKVRDKVDQAKPDIPREAEEPSVFEINISQLPIIYVALTGDIGLPALNEIAEDLEDKIEGIPGVLGVDIVGGTEREIPIEVDPNRVAQYGVSLADLAMLAQIENVNVPAGAMELGEAKYLMRTPGEIKNADDLNYLVVKRGETGSVLLQDIARAKDDFKDIASYSRLNGKPSITLTISKRSGKNVIEVSDAIHRAVEETNARLPMGVKAEITYDESNDIRDMVHELEDGILSGLILVLVVLFAFLGFANAFFVALAIPFSLFITFTYFMMTGVTLNMVVLFSLILVLGMLVDDGVVVVENMFRHMQIGYPREQAARDGAGEVAYAVIGSTITKVAAFVPMFFWPGVWGKFMVFLPLTVTVALAASLFVALVVNPVLASMFMRVSPKQVKKHASQHHYILQAYGAVVRFALRWRVATLVLAFTALVVIAAIYGAGAEVQFTPEVEPPMAFIDIEAPEGTNLDTSDGFVRQVEKMIEPYAQNIQFVIANVGSSGANMFGGFSGASSHLSRVTMDFPPLQETDVLPSTIVKSVRAHLGEVVGADVRSQKLDMGPPTKPPVNVEISGDDYATLAKLAENVRERIKNVPGLLNLRDDYNKGKPEVRVRVDRQEALRTGLNTTIIGNTVKAAVNGQRAGKYREGDEEYDVVVRFPRTFREDLTNLENMSLINLAGLSVPFSSVAKVELGAGYGTIRHIDRKRTVTVSAEVTEGHQGPEVLKSVQEVLKDFSLPASYTIQYTGENEDTQETQDFMVRAFGVAMLLTALALVGQFNSVTQSVIIMTSVVLSLGGVFLGLLIFDMPFGILMTGIACISLAGVAVNNAIVLLDFTNVLKTRGYSTNDALVEAGCIRFRPVMLTTMTTTLGLIPMAIGISFDFRKLEWVKGGMSSSWWGPMAIAIIAGLLFTTVLTLVVVPTLYSLNDEIRATLRRKSATSESAPVVAPTE